MRPTFAMEIATMPRMANRVSQSASPIILIVDGVSSMEMMDG